MERIPNVTPGEILLEEFLVPMGITAYRLAKDTGMPATRDYQVELWRGSDDWRNALPNGLRVTAEEEPDTIGFYLANSYAEQAITGTLLSDFSSAFDDMIEASDIFAEFGYLGEAIWCFLGFINNCYNLGEYGTVIEANPHVADIMMISPQDVAIEDILALGGLSAHSAMNLGDFRTTY